MKWIYVPCSCIDKKLTLQHIRKRKSHLTYSLNVHHQLFDCSNVLRVHHASYSVDRDRTGHIDITCKYLNLRNFLQIFSCRVNNPHKYETSMKHNVKQEHLHPVSFCLIVSTTPRYRSRESSPSSQ